MLKRITYLIFTFALFGAFAQNNLEAIEQGVNLRLKELRSAKEDDKKLELNQKLVDTLKYALSQDGAFEYSFASLKSMGTIKSPDDKFRLFNWNIEMQDQTQRYFCLLLTYDSRKKKYVTVEFKDNSFLLPARPDNVLNPKNWYGALYYKIIPKKRGSRTYYTVLGYDGNNQVSTVKIIDVFTFSGTRIKIGAPIFVTNDGTSKRLFFEYSKMATMSLKFDNERDMIIMDHLAPESENLKDFPEYYVPDLTYDAMVFDKGKWVLKNNIIAVNKKGKKKIKIYAQNEDGDLEEKEIEDKWLNPNDKNSPIDNGNHIAITPDKEANLREKALKKNQKKQKNNDSNLFNPYGKNKKQKKRKKKNKKKKPYSIYDFKR